jgi:hypothetical protein
MSVIIARSGSGAGTGGTPITYTSSLPAVTTQALILPSASIIVDDVPISTWGSSKWYVSVATKSGTRMCAYEIHATYDVVNGSAFNTYAIVGDAINQTATVFLLGTTALVLQITNNEVEDIIVYTTRLAVPIVSIAANSISGILLDHTAVNINAGTTGIVDSLVSPKLGAIKWIVSVTDSNDTKAVFQVFALTASGGVRTNVMYGKIGNTAMNFTVDVTVVGSLLQLSITNSDVVSFRVTTTRILIRPELPQSSVVPGTVSPWIVPVTTIAPGYTAGVDTQITIPGHDAVKWMVVVNQPSTSKTQAFEVIGFYQNLSLPNNLVYSIIGSRLDVSVDVSINGLKLILMLTNSETTPVKVYLIRLPVSI